MDIDLETLNEAARVVGNSARAADSALGVAKTLKSIFGSPEVPRNAELESLIVDLMVELTETKLANVTLK